MKQKQQEQQRQKNPRVITSGDQLSPSHYINKGTEWKTEDTANFSHAQRLIYNFLLTGWYTSREMSIQTGYLDTRSIIRRIKKKGITVLERWYKRQNGEKFKKFTIIPPKEESISDIEGVKSIHDIMDKHFKHLKRDGKK